MLITYENGHIVIRIPCDALAIARALPSKSGRNRLLATTSGFVPVNGAPPGIRIAINVVAPLKE